ncbi:MAG TPA: DUF2723 domain-containing protein [Candidatus Rubrimentiphilum sp.]|nr:DUF2723 domain-containing protein [Candidatus Rubrimentiphilum sp.]
MPLGVYIASLEGAVAYWDTGEAQVVPWIFGIAHPTGFPVFVIAAGIFAHIFPIGAVSWRIALFSAIAMSLTALMVFSILRELAPKAETWIAAAAAWIFAFGEIVWTRGTRAEVHALAVCLSAVTLYFAVRWYARAEQRSLVWGALCWGMAIATHPIAAMLAPALCVIFFARIRRLKRATFVLALLALISGVAFYAYLPLRSAAITNARLDPTRAIGEPPGRAFWDLDHPSTMSGLRHYLSGADYGAGGVFASMIRVETYAAGGPRFFEALWHEFAPLGLLFLFGGLVMFFRRDAIAGIALFLAAAVPLSFALGYTIEADPGRYYLIPFFVVAIFIGYGALRIAAELPAMRLTTLFVMFGLAIGLIVLNRNIFAQPHDLGAKPLIATVIAKTSDGAILLAPWIDSTALAYAAYVQHSLGHRIVESAWLSDEAARVPGWVNAGRNVYVVDQIFGSVNGYKLIKIPGSPDLYRVVKE